MNSDRRFWHGPGFTWRVAAAMSVALTGCQNNGATRPAPDIMAIRYEVHGSVTETQQLASSVNTNHYCSTSALAWGHTESGVEIPQGPPTFRLDFDLQADAARPGLSLVAFGYTQGVTQHADPADDWIAVNAGGKQWVGHGLQRDPAFNISLTFAVDGRSGTFAAHALHPGPIEQPADIASTVDVSGSWSCAFARGAE